MDIQHFRKSAAALGPYFSRMAAETSPAGLRLLGMQAEGAMLAATGGVNTHKGAIWTMGLLCAAAGALPEHALADAETVCDEAARIAAAIIGLAPMERKGPRGIQTGDASGAETPLTRGEKARARYGLRSARDEAAAGFPSIRSLALPLARSLEEAMTDEDETVISVLLAVMAHADDTCIVARGGLEALLRARTSAERVLDAGGPFSARGLPLYDRMRREFATARISPGGSADLCAATLFLAGLERQQASSRTLFQPRRRVMLTP